jgi:hypothetical protein
LRPSARGEKPETGGESMPAIAREQAVQMMRNEVDRLDAGDLVEFHNELFPRNKVPRQAVQGDVTPLFEKIVEHFNRGLEVDEILDLWNFLFPEKHVDAYDEEADALEYKDKSDPYYYDEESLDD